jgi:hypothetical protein
MYLNSLLSPNRRKSRKRKGNKNLERNKDLNFLDIENEKQNKKQKNKNLTLRILEVAVVSLIPSSRLSELVRLASVPCLSDTEMQHKSKQPRSMVRSDFKLTKYPISREV